MTGVPALTGQVIGEAAEAVRALLHKVLIVIAIQRRRRPAPAAPADAETAGTAQPQST